MVPRFLHLHCAFDEGDGGAGARCARLIDAFGKAADHAIVSADPDRRGAAALIGKGARVSWPGAFPSLKGKPFPGRLRRLAEAMRGYDLVLTYGWDAIDAVMAHTLFADVFKLPPLIHHEDGFDAAEANGPKRARTLYRRLALGRTDALVVPTRTLERIALDVWNLPQARLRRISDGIDTARFGGKGDPLLLPGLIKREDEHWIGTLADMDTTENLPALVRAVAALPDEWQLVIVGEGPARAAVVAEAERLGVDDRVHLPGAADPAGITALFDIFAQTQGSERFPSPSCRPWRQACQSWPPTSATWPRSWQSRTASGSCPRTTKRHWPRRSGA